MTFRELWRPPLSWWLTGLGVALFCAVSIHSGGHGLRAVLPYVVLPLLAVLALASLSRQRVVVEGGVLHVPGARAPLAAFGPAEVLDREALRRWRGPRAQRDAWVRVRPWMRAGVLLPVTDPADDTPYWLIGTRRPVDLAVAVSPVPDTPA